MLFDQSQVRLSSGCAGAVDTLLLAAMQSVLPTHGHKEDCNVSSALPMVEVYAIRQCCCSAAGDTKGKGGVEGGCQQEHPA